VPVSVGSSVGSDDDDVGDFGDGELIGDAGLESEVVAVARGDLDVSGTGLTVPGPVLLTTSSPAREIASQTSVEPSATTTSQTAT